METIKVDKYKWSALKQCWELHRIIVAEYRYSCFVWGMYKGKLPCDQCYKYVLHGITDCVILTSHSSLFD